MSGALEEYIHRIPLFAQAGPDDLPQLLQLLRSVELRAGDVLFREGEAGRGMWVLGDGAEVSVTSTGGGQARPVVVMYAKTGDVLGEMALVDDAPRSGTAVVTSDGRAHHIDGLAFEELRSALNPAAFKVLRVIAKDLCRRLRATVERIVPASNATLRTLPLSRTRPSTEMIDAFPAFSGLSHLVKLALAQRLELIEVAEVTPLFGEGEASDGVYFILAGQVSVGRNGKTLANLPAGTMFGQVACIDAGPRTASCLTEGPAQILRMSNRDFEHLFAAGHRFALQLVDLVTRQLVAHLRDANRMIPRPGRAAAPAGVARPIGRMIPSAPSAADLELISTEIELELETALPGDP